MQDAASLFAGMHDLRSFTEDDPEEKSTTLKLDRLQVLEHGDLILVRIVGSHFIWKVVRRIVGVLVEAGRGKLSKNDIARVSAHRYRSARPLHRPAVRVVP